MWRRNLVQAKDDLDLKETMEKKKS